jgi:excisionase family DNA binding protein
MTMPRTKPPDRRDERRPFISVHEAADWLGISVGLAYEMVHEHLAAGAGGIPAIRFGRRILVPVAGLERLADGGDGRPAA